MIDVFCGLFSPWFLLLKWCFERTRFGEVWVLDISRTFIYVNTVFRDMLPWHTIRISDCINSTIQAFEKCVVFRYVNEYDIKFFLVGALIAKYHNLNNRTRDTWLYTLSMGCHTVSPAPVWVRVLNPCIIAQVLEHCFHVPYRHSVSEGGSVSSS